MVITYAPRFIRQLKKLEPGLKAEAKEKISLFMGNPRDHSLRVHKLHGNLSDCWAFSINHKYRIIFEYLSKNRFNFLTIDDHDIYKR